MKTFPCQVCWWLYFFKVLAVLGLHCCTWSFSSWGKWGLLSSSGVWASHLKHSFITVWKWAFSWCLLSPLPLSLLFFTSVFYGLLISPDLYNITLALPLREIHRYWPLFRASHSVPPAWFTFPLFPLLLIFAPVGFLSGNLWYQITLCENHTLFRIGCLGN